MSYPKYLINIDKNKSDTIDIKESEDGKQTINVPNSDHWYEDAAKKVNAVSGDTYVKLKYGVLTVNQINSFLDALTKGFMNYAFIDDNQQLLYNKIGSTDDCIKDVGNKLATCHPKEERYQREIQQVVYALKHKIRDIVPEPYPTNTLDNFVMEFYQRMEDENGNFAGVTSWGANVSPFIKYYLKTTGQKLVPDPDATSGATYVRNSKSDASTGASHKVDSDTLIDNSDASTGASEKEETSVENKETDASSGASSH